MTNPRAGLDAVDVASNEVPSMVRISPGSTDDAYLWHKLPGTAARSPTSSSI